ncbi:MerR family DNA-binding transcriptional regulator [Candidatus Marinamargulisbacteria bacterium SCGC AG-333-B06]|nr:MerR family DNA-binding transcriptional regulator [Candidatus Marinamargulisbacteria bacterium SCGC AG-333-B06]
MSQKKEFITIKEAAEILSVSRDTLRRWDKAGKLKTKRHPMNNFRIYNPAEVEDLKKAIIGGKAE